MDPSIARRLPARLLEVMLKMDKDKNQIRPLAVNERHRIDDRFWVTLYDANHCPGAVMFLFESERFATTLCTGDMRCDERMLDMFENVDVFRRLQEVIDDIFLMKLMGRYDSCLMCMMVRFFVAD